MLANSAFNPLLQFKPGDWVIYRKQKISTSPGPRAQQTAPAAKGETYNYVVEKYWVVQEILSDGLLRLRTRKGKTHDVAPDDPRLRRARWWERWLLSDRFTQVEQAAEQKKEYATNAG